MAALTPASRLATFGKADGDPLSSSRHRWLVLRTSTTWLHTALASARSCWNQKVRLKAPEAATHWVPVPYVTVHCIAVGWVLTVRA